MALGALAVLVALGALAVVVRPVARADDAGAGVAGRSLAEALTPPPAGLSDDEAEALAPRRGLVSPAGARALSIYRLGREVIPRRSSARARRRILAESSSRASLADDGVTGFAYAFRDGGLVFSPAAPGGRRVSDIGSVLETAFSADRRLAAVAGQQAIRVVSVSSGELVRVIPADAPRGLLFLSGDRLAYLQGCQPAVVAVRTAAPIAFEGPRACGVVLGVDRVGPAWILGEAMPRASAATRVAYAAVERLELGSWARTTLLPAANGPYEEPRVSAGARRACYVRDATEGPRLYCRELPGGEPVRVAELPIAYLGEFDARGRRLLFATPHGRRGFVPHVVELEDRVVRRVATAPREGWVLLPAGRRLVGAGAVRAGLPAAVIIDLDRGEEIAVDAPSGVELEGISVAPGVDRGFVLGQERGALRDLYWVEVPGA